MRARAPSRLQLKHMHRQEPGALVEHVAEEALERGTRRRRECPQRLLCLAILRDHAVEVARLDGFAPKPARNLLDQLRLLLLTDSVRIDAEGRRRRQRAGARLHGSYEPRIGRERLCAPYGGCARVVASRLPLGLSERVQRAQSAQHCHRGLRLRGAGHAGTQSQRAGAPHQRRLRCMLSPRTGEVRVNIYHSTVCTRGRYGCRTLTRYGIVTNGSIVSGPGRLSVRILGAA